MAAEKTLEESKRRRRRDASAEAEPRTGGKGYATPSRRDDEEPEEKGIIASARSPFERFADFLQDVRGELSKVVWPTREEAFRLTRIVLITLIVSALVMGIISFLMSKFVEFGLNYPIVLVAAFIAIVGAAVYGIQFSGTTKRGY
jgi:preprotein translocase subunit SecE